jgi:hypothetical protein
MILFKKEWRKMATTKTDAICFICGKTLVKTAAKNHIVKEHSDGGEECVLLKIEGAYDKEYWLYVDAPKKDALEELDDFLRQIWMECCGHMSVFYAGGPYNEVDSSRKLSSFAAGDKITYAYDMGSTTECLITFAGETRRPKQKDSVRVLARNIAPVFECASCGKPAAHICRECMYDSDNPNYCEKCLDKHEHEYELALPITNSPRNGECGYCGEYDVFVYQSGEDARERNS